MFKCLSNLYYSIEDIISKSINVYKKKKKKNIIILNYFIIKFFNLIIIFKFMTFYNYVKLLLHFTVIVLCKII